MEPSSAILSSAEGESGSRSSGGAWRVASGPRPGTRILATNPPGPRTVLAFSMEAVAWSSFSLAKDTVLSSAPSVICLTLASRSLSAASSKASAAALYLETRQRSQPKETVTNANEIMGSTCTVGAMSPVDTKRKADVSLVERFCCMTAPGWKAAAVISAERVERRRRNIPLVKCTCGI